MRLTIISLAKLHVAVDDVTLCGLRISSRLDGYSDETGLRVWNQPTASHCALCARSLTVNAHGEQRQHTARKAAA